MQKPPVARCEIQEIQGRKINAPKCRLSSQNRRQGSGKHPKEPAVETGNPTAKVKGHVRNGRHVGSSSLNRDLIYTYTYIYIYYIICIYIYNIYDMYVIYHLINLHKPTSYGNHHCSICLTGKSSINGPLSIAAIAMLVY